MYIINFYFCLGGIVSNISFLNNKTGSVAFVKPLLSYINLKIEKYPLALLSTLPFFKKGRRLASPRIYFFYQRLAV
jgi:hypothetical protein